MHARSFALSAPPLTRRALLEAACLVACGAHSAQWAGFAAGQETASQPGLAESNWETTNASEEALRRGLGWLAANQGPDGNWSSKDLGLVGMGALAFLAAGHLPGRGVYGNRVQAALDYITEHARPSGLLNITGPQRDMYNHGLATFVLGQAYGMSVSTSDRLGEVLDRALRLIAQTQAEDGGWSYQARRLPRGHDLSLIVMQAKALRSAVDSGLEAPQEVIDAAIRSVREHYSPANGRRFGPEEEQRQSPGQFTYGKGGGGGTVAMAAAGVVCLQEFGQYDDWRIDKNMEVILERTSRLPSPSARDGILPFDAYSLYYVGQAAYQTGGRYWRTIYPILRDFLIASQQWTADDSEQDGVWHDRAVNGGGRVGGKPGDLYATAVASFVLAIPNRYLPILQDGRIQRFAKNADKSDAGP